LEAVSEKMISFKTNAFGFVGLMKASDFDEASGLSAEAPNLEDIMIYHEKRKEQL
jgi:ABC-2 type transport system ATP-binding protein